jgi:hypothetical protein
MNVRKTAALTGALVGLGGAAATALIAGPAMAGTSAASATHTISFNAAQIASHGANAVDKDTHAGKVIGYDVRNAYSANGTYVALSVKGGVLIGWFTTSDSGALSGRITGGNGTYKGDTGTIKGQGTANGANVTVTYRHN